jgi:hypothetical protein
MKRMNKDCTERFKKRGKEGKSGNEKPRRGKKVGYNKLKD